MCTRHRHNPRFNLYIAAKIHVIVKHVIQVYIAEPRSGEHNNIVSCSYTAVIYYYNISYHNNDCNNNIIYGVCIEEPSREEIDGSGVRSTRRRRQPPTRRRNVSPGKKSASPLASQCLRQHYTRLRVHPRPPPSG